MVGWPKNLDLEFPEGLADPERLADRRDPGYASVWLEASIVPNGHDQTAYLQLYDFGRRGCAWRETDVELSDLEAVIYDLMSGQYSDPVTVVAVTWPNDGPAMSRKSRARSL